MVRVFILCAMIVTLAAAPSCIAVGGTDNSPRPTKGQELIDLKTALDRGAITQPEYQQTKAGILARARM